MRISVTHDNEVLREGLTGGWGFSCLIDDDVLFDTGSDGTALLHNMKKMVTNPGNIESVALSHDHLNHTGGLSKILEENNRLSVYALPSFYAKCKNRIPVKANLVEVRGSTRIREGVLTTGALGTQIREQSLICLDNRGVLVIAGCSHSGAQNIINVASKFGKVYGIGGLQGFSDFEILKGLKLISPCHCTAHKEGIARAFQKQYVRCGAGLVIK